MLDIKCTVKSVKGFCFAGYKPGDYFLVKDGLMIEQGNFFGIAFLANLRRLYSRPPPQSTDMLPGVCRRRHQLSGRLYPEYSDSSLSSYGQYSPPC